MALLRRPPDSVCVFFFLSTVSSNNVRTGFFFTSSSSLLFPSHQLFATAKITDFKAPAWACNCHEASLLRRLVADSFCLGVM